MNAAMRPALRCRPVPARNAWTRYEVFATAKRFAHSMLADIPVMFCKVVLNSVSKNKATRTRKVLSAHPFRSNDLVLLSCSYVRLEQSCIGS